MTVLIVLSIGLLLWLISGIRIAEENQRFAVFALGRFYGLKGPGVLMKLHGTEAKWVRVSVGDRAELVAPNIAKLEDVQIPIETDSNIALGSTIRVVGFKEASLIGVPNPDQTRKITCEKCGHEMAI